MLRKDDSNFYCKNGRWTLLPFLQLPQFQHTSILPLGPCKNEMFKPDWPCNRCRCNQTENVWECPLELCREDTIIKNYSHESRLDRVYEFFKFDGTKEICKEGEIRNEDVCNRCICKESIWWCKLKECPDVIEQDSIAADTLPEFLEIELPPGMESIKEQEGNEIIKICNPGSRYKRGCNTCNCSMDGTAETCTQSVCDHLGNFQDEFLKNYYEENEYLNTDYYEYDNENYYEYYKYLDEKHEMEYYSGEYEAIETDKFGYDDLNDDEDEYDKPSEGYVDEDDSYYEYYDQLE
nr:uncharacterized protein LOC111423215 [Onthophagus taurus]